MATSVLPPTQITVPAGDTRWPSSSGFALPAGATLFDGTIDTSAMPAGDSFWIESEYLVNGVWQAGQGVLVTGGTHPQRGGGSATTVAFAGGIPQNPYPTKARFHTYGGTTADTVTVSGAIE